MKFAEDLNTECLKGVERMTEKKRFEYKNHKVFDNLTGEEHSSNMVSVNVLNQLARVNREGVKKVQKLAKENEQLKQSVNNLKETILKITIAYQRKHDNTIVNLVDEVHEEDITDLIKELQE